LAQGAKAGSSALGAPVVGSLAIEATNTTSASSDGTAAAGGIFSGVGAAISAEVTPTVSASLSDSSNVHLTGSASVHATATDDASADATGASIAAGSAGSTNAEAVLQPTVNAFVGSNAVLVLGGGLELEAVNATSQGVSATASASQGSLLGGNGA